jgi:hypothetical protein
MTTAAGKPRTEAQAIITRLQFSGMKRAEISKQLGVSAETVKAIAAGKSSGMTYLTQLRQMARFTPASPRVPAPTGDPTVSPSPAPAAPPTADPETVAAIPAIGVEEAPKDTRSAGQRFKDALKDAVSGKAHDSARADLSTVVKRQSRSSSGDAGATNETLTDQLVPLVALAVVILTQLALPERYSAVGPQHEEASAILKPLVRAMTRQLEVAGQLTETQMDILAALAAMGLYADRAWHTYKDIRAAEASRGRVVDEYPGRAGSNGYSAGHNGASNHAAPAAADPLGSAYAPSAFGPGGQGPSSPFAGGSPGGGQGQHYITSPAAGEQSSGDVQGGAAGEVGRGPDPFASIYAADAIGRRQLGIN